jgi:hypothetical protein
LNFEKLFATRNSTKLHKPVLEGGINGGKEFTLKVTTWVNHYDQANQKAVISWVLFWGPFRGLV